MLLPSSEKKIVFYKFYEMIVILSHILNDNTYLPKGYHLDVVGGPSTPHDPESDAGGSLSSWQGHPSR
jgi:hypothetical protein